jgi:hypothetical protein
MLNHPKYATTRIGLILLINLALSSYGHLSAQSFWKKSGTITDAAALHSSVLYSKRTNTLFVATYNMGIFRSTDNGNSWNNVLILPKDQPVFSLFETFNGDILAGGIGKIYRSDSLGEKWDDIPIDFTIVKNIVEVKNGPLFLCSADSGGILKSTDNGLTWHLFTNGLPSKYVNNLVADSMGNLFCTLINDQTDINGGLYFLNAGTNQWEKKNITITIEDTNYKLKVSAITAITITKNQQIYVSLDAVVTNYAITGIFSNSVTRAVANEIWEQEQRNGTPGIPFYFLARGMFSSSNGHLFVCRTYAIFSKMNYSASWSNCDGGLGNVSYSGQFSEKPDGTVLFVPEFSNQVYQTFESVPGKQAQKIVFPPLPNMKLYEYMELKATSSSGLKVKFASHDTDKATIEDNLLRAVGLPDVTIRAYVDGNDTLYYTEENQRLYIGKASNTITIEPIVDRIEGDPPFEVSAHASSGEPVHFEVITGNAQFIGNTLSFSSAGRIQFIATEQGNGSYEIADTIAISFCVNPLKPVIHLDTSNSGIISLSSSATAGNRWYVNGNLIDSIESTITPTQSGIYTLRTDVNGCISEESMPVTVTSAGNMSGNRGFAIYPQPFFERLVIKLNNNSNTTWRTIVMDNQGRRVLDVFESSNTLLLDTRNLPAGWYLLKILSGDQIYYAKAIKMK